MEEIFNWFKESRPIVAIIGILVLFWFSFNTVKITLRNYELAQQIDNLEEEIAVLELENQNFKFQINYYQTDAYLDLEARDKLNVVSPGERLLILPDDRYDGVSVSTESEASDESQVKQNFDEWMNFFFGANG